MCLSHLAEQLRRGLNPEPSPLTSGLERDALEEGRARILIQLLRAKTLLFSRPYSHSLAASGQGIP